VNDNGSATIRPMHTLDIVVRGTSVSTRLLTPLKTSPLNRPFHIDPRGRESITLLEKVLRYAIDQAETEDSLHPELYKELLNVLGRELFEVLLANEHVRSRVVEQLRRVKDEEISLRINLSFDGDDEQASWLRGLPWEYMHTPIDDDSLGVGGGFLSEHAELLLSRRLQVASRLLGGDEGSKLTVLLVSSSPKELEPQIAATGSAQQIAEVLKKLPLFTLEELIENPPDPAVPTDYKWLVTYKNLRERVEALNPDVVHFVGHGQCRSKRGELALVNPDGSADWIGDCDFAEAVCQGKNLKLVFLQACESALPPPYIGLSGVAQQVASKEVPAVIAMQYPIKAGTANKFAVAFYNALGENLDVDVAVERGRAAIRRTDDPAERERLSFGLPVVYLSSYGALLARKGDGQSRIGSKSDAGTPGPPACLCGKLPVGDEEFCIRCGLPRRCQNHASPVPFPLGARHCPTCGLPRQAPTLTPGQPADTGTLDVVQESSTESVVTATHGPVQEIRG